MVTRPVANCGSTQSTGTLIVMRARVSDADGERKPAGNCWEIVQRATGIVCPFDACVRDSRPRRLSANDPGDDSASAEVISCVSAKCRFGRAVAHGGTATALVGSTLELRKNGNLMFFLPSVFSK